MFMSQKKKREYLAYKPLFQTLISREAVLRQLMPRNDPIAQPLSMGIQQSGHLASSRSTIALSLSSQDSAHLLVLEVSMVMGCQPQ